MGSSGRRVTLPLVAAASWLESGISGLERQLLTQRMTCNTQWLWAPQAASWWPCGWSQATIVLSLACWSMRGRFTVGSSMIRRGTPHQYIKLWLGWTLVCHWLQPEHPQELCPLPCCSCSNLLRRVSGLRHREATVRASYPLLSSSNYAIRYGTLFRNC